MTVKETVSEILYEAVARDALISVLPVVAADYVTGEILYVNQLAEMLFGYGRGELLGKSVEDLLPDDLKERHAEHRLAPGIARARVMGFGGPLRGKKKNGTVFPAYIGLAEKQATERRVGVTFIIDMTGYVGDAPPYKAKGHP
jgi:PAS domain S-box-containing protein